MTMKTKIKRTSPAVAGTYVYDEKLGKVVQVSDRIPKVASKSGGSPEPGPSCGRGSCEGCPGMP